MCYILLGITGHLKRNWNIVNKGVGSEGEVVYPPYNKTVFIGMVYYIVYTYYMYIAYISILFYVHLFYLYIPIHIL